MSAVLLPLPMGEGRGEGQRRVEEPSAKYLALLDRPLIRSFDLLAGSPGGLAKLRELILTLAVQGKLVPQDPRDEPACVLLQKIRAEKDRLIERGRIKRDKPPTAIAEEEKPFALPQGWEWVKCTDYFDELCTGPFGSVIHQEDYVRDGVPLINPSHMIDGQIVHDPRVTLKQEDAQRLSAYALSDGDVVLARRGEVGRFALVTQRENGWLCGTGSFFIRLHGSCDRKYLGLVFTDTRFRQELLGQSVGATMTNLNQRILLEALIAIPPLAEQSRIVARVEQLMGLCDALEAKGRLEAAQHAQLVSTLLGTLTESDTPEALAENWQRIATHFDLLLDRPEAVDALEQTILQLAVRGLLVPQDPIDEPASVLLKKIRAEKSRLVAAGKIKRDTPLPPIALEERPFGLAEGWEWVRVGEIVEMLNGYAFKSEWFKSSGIRLLRNLNVGHGTVDWTHPVFVDRAAVTEFEQFVLREGDIVLSLDRPIISTGLKFAVLTAADLPCFLLQRVARLAPEPEGMTAEYLLLWLQSDLFMGTIDPGRSNGVPHISTKQVGGLIAGLPPLTEQSRIVTRVNELRRLCSDLRQRLSASQTTQAHLADALVASAA
jgi:type I restriction enzyme, S subunit